jgi:four helix bundle protein
MPIENYERLKVWQKGIEIVEFIYQISRRFPAEERFGLTIQMQRAAVSIPSNVAEGHDRGNQMNIDDFVRSRQVHALN